MKLIVIVLSVTVYIQGLLEHSAVRADMLKYLYVLPSDKKRTLYIYFTDRLNRALGTNNVSSLNKSK